MKNLLAILLLVAAVQTFPTMVYGQTADEAKPEPNQTVANRRTPKFDDFLHRLENCKGLIKALAQWSKVIKPTLQELGYSEDRIKSIKKALAKDAVTLDDVSEFSRKWLAKYGEQLVANEIHQYFCREKNPHKAVEVAANLSPGQVQ